MPFPKPTFWKEALTANEVCQMQVDEMYQGTSVGPRVGTYGPNHIGGVYPAPPDLRDPVENENIRDRMLRMRLRIPEGQLPPYQHLNTALAGDKVFVFVVNRDEAVILEDSRDLFPSDDLVTQLRLIA
jgi:hypothetical protein